MKLIAQALLYMHLISCAHSVTNSRYPASPRPFSPPPNKVSCLTQPVRSAKSPARKRGSDQAKKALSEYQDSLTSNIWDYSNLDNSRQLTNILKLYSLNKRAQKLKFINIFEKTPQLIHQELLAHGFYHKRIPLAVDLAEEPLRYWKIDGSSTQDLNDPELLPFDIYVHSDGSMVKVKPLGIPDPSHKEPRRQPHASMAVLITLEKDCDPHNYCSYDTSFDNEAFKISKNRQPLPKSPNGRWGMKHLSGNPEINGSNELTTALQEEEAGWAETIMDAAHIDIPTDYSHCQ